MAVERAWPNVQRRFKYKPNLRAHCGEMGTQVRRTTSFHDALSRCSATPGCTVVTKNSADRTAYLCKAAYTIEAYDPSWSSAVLLDPPPYHNYSLAVAVQNWNHFALTYDSGELEFYVNGFLQSRTQVQLPTPPSSVTVGGSIRWYEQAFPGQIGPLRVWPRRLQPNEVAMSMTSQLASKGLLADVVLSTHWKGPPVLRSGWSAPPLPQAPSDCAAAVVVPVFSASAQQLQTLAAHLQLYAGGRCSAQVFLVGCVERALGELREGGAKGGPNFNLVQPSEELPQWDACARYGLQHVLAREQREAQGQQQEQGKWGNAKKGKEEQERAGPAYVALVYESLLPMEGWLLGLVGDLHSNPEAGAAFSKVLQPTGEIRTAGLSFQAAFVDFTAVQTVVPVEMYAGYPWNYGPANSTQPIPAAGCSALLLRTADLSSLLEGGAFSHQLGDWYSCVDLALQLRDGGRAVLLSPASTLLDMAGPSRVDTQVAELEAFHKRWGRQLEAQYAAGLAFNATVSWVMHCGGALGIEAFNLVQHLEGRLKLRAQIQRGAPWCEDVEVLQGAPEAFADRVARLRRLTEYVPSDIMIYHKDYLHLGGWAWPPGNTSSYLIGRYMWEVEGIHKQWVEQIKDELDEVWVPSRWNLELLTRHGVPASKVVVIPKSLDSHLYDPAIWEPVTLPHQRRVSFLAVFKLEDRKGWQVLLSAYLKAFKDCTDVSLYIHTVMHPQLSYRRDLVFEVMNAFLRESNDTYLRSVSLYPDATKGAPHVYVIGQHLTQREMVRIYASVDAFVLPSRGEAWGMTYMEAMSMGKPVIATNWSGMTEFLKPDFAYLLNYTINPVHSTDRWFRGAKWAEPSLPSLMAAFKAAYDNQDLAVMGRKARREVAQVYDNKVVSGKIYDRLKQVSARLPASRPGKQVDVCKAPVPTDVHMCALMPRAPITVRRTGAALKVAVLSTAPPRRCGIATFNTALLKRLEPLLPQGSEVVVFPLVWDVQMTEDDDGGDEEVVVRQENYGDYLSIAKTINGGGFHVVLFQQEFGIFGGSFGILAVCLARMLQMPTITVMHTISDNLLDGHQYVLLNMAASSTKVVVMSELSRNKLGAYHGIPNTNVVVIPHGAPQPSSISQQAAQALLNATGRTVLMSNGLLHPGKGIDLTLEALPGVVAEFPSVVFFIVGEAHPDCGRTCADYYQHLQQMAADPRIRNHVRFIDTFVEDELLLKYIQAADIYVLAYKDRVTTNSGTLTMAMAAGKAVVSTPFAHAASALVGRGVLVDFENWRSLQAGILKLLRSESLRTKYGKAAREYTQGMEWSHVARQYLDLLRNVTV